MLTDQADRYFGIVDTAKAYDVAVAEDQKIGDLAMLREIALRPMQDVREAIRLFDLSEADYLAVVDDEGHVLGTLSERISCTAATPMRSRKRSERFSVNEEMRSEGGGPSPGTEGRARGGSS